MFKEFIMITINGGLRCKNLDWIDRDTYIRQIILDHYTHKPKSVISVVPGRFTRTTTQTAMDKDYRVVTIFNSGFLTDTYIEQMIDGEWTTEHSLTWQTIKLSKEMGEWLADSSIRGNGTLPENIGWDGVYTVNNIRKTNRIRQFFLGVDTPGWIDHIAQIAMKESYIVVPTAWSEASNEFPERMVAEYTFGWDTDTLIRKSIEWVIWYQDGSNNHFHVLPNSPTPPEKPMRTIQSMSVTDNIVRLVRIERGYRKVGDRTGGVRWELFDRSVPCQESLISHQNY